MATQAPPSAAAPPAQCEAHPDAPTWRTDGFPLAKKTHIGCWRCHLARVRALLVCVRKGRARRGGVLTNQSVDSGR